jgi:hypothetical protein
LLQRKIHIGTFAAFRVLGFVLEKKLRANFSIELSCPAENGLLATQDRNAGVEAVEATASEID